MRKPLLILGIVLVIGAGVVAITALGAFRWWQSRGGPSPVEIVQTDRVQAWAADQLSRIAGDLLNPTRFFGGALKMVPNMLRVASDINGFLDMRKTETFYATEYHLRS